MSEYPRCSPKQTEKEILEPSAKFFEYEFRPSLEMLASCSFNFLREEKQLGILGV